MTDQQTQAVVFEGRIRIEFGLDEGPRGDYEPRTVEDVLRSLAGRYHEHAALHLEDMIESAIIERIERNAGGPVTVSKIEFNRVDSLGEFREGGRVVTPPSV